ncbi:unnamed protein product [Aureobasidium vineae]|uniref:PHF5-like protein n=1 Tax=Aureobasidium vineae TaxID=2773715 RepID=A0A9N8P9B6_9PEZI|nr:unnamed protein product [Aureobasidium vineae]
MSRHHPDLVMCRKTAGIAIGRLCDKCDGKCPVCDSYVRPTTLVRICDECSFGNYQNKCVVCGGEHYEGNYGYSGHLVTNIARHCADGKCLAMALHQRPQVRNAKQRSSD